MADLKVEVDPAEAGFAQDRLARIDHHFARYVDDGRLPGWLLLVRRGGRIVHLASYGARDRDAGLPVELDGVRLLGGRTVRYMTRNHLPGGVDLEQFGRPLFAETTFDGVGFGLEFSVVIDPVQNKVLSTAGESSTHPIRPQLKHLVYRALVEP